MVFHYTKAEIKHPSFNHLCLYCSLYKYNTDVLGYQYYKRACHHPNLNTTLQTLSNNNTNKQAYHAQT